MKTDKQIGNSDGIIHQIIVGIGIHSVRCGRQIQVFSLDDGTIGYSLKFTAFELDKVNCPDCLKARELKYSINANL